MATSTSPAQGAERDAHEHVLRRLPDGAVGAAADQVGALQGAQPEEAQVEISFRDDGRVQLFFVLDYKVIDVLREQRLVLAVGYVVEKSSAVLREGKAHGLLERLGQNAPAQQAVVVVAQRAGRAGPRGQFVKIHPSDFAVRKQPLNSHGGLHWVHIQALSKTPQGGRERGVVVGFLGFGFARDVDSGHGVCVSVSCCVRCLWWSPGKNTWGCKRRVGNFKKKILLFNLK